PGLLDDVLGVRRGAEHLVRDGEQQVAVPGERVGAHAGGARAGDAHAGETALDGSASGSAQTFEKPCDSTPIATLARVVRFASPIHVVSSTIAAGPSASSRRADSASVTVGGVLVMASAYSSTSRSRGVKASDERHRGTSLALASSSFSLCTMK